MGRPLSEPDADRAAASGQSLLTLQEGRRLYAISCSGCHRLYQPEEHTLEIWKEVMPTMTKKAKLTSDQTNKVIAYIDAMTVVR